MFSEEQISSCTELLEGIAIDGAKAPRKLLVLWVFDLIWLEVLEKTEATPKTSRVEVFFCSGEMTQQGHGK